MCVRAIRVLIPITKVMYLVAVLTPRLQDGLRLLGVAHEHGTQHVHAGAQKLCLHHHGAGVAVADEVCAEARALVARLLHPAAVQREGGPRGFVRVWYGLMAGPPQVQHAQQQPHNIAATQNERGGL